MREQSNNASIHLKRHLGRDFVLPGDLAQRYRELVDEVRIAPPTEKLTAFSKIARATAKLVGSDFPRREAADRLWATAQAYGLLKAFGPAAVQLELAAAFKQYGLVLHDRENSGQTNNICKPDLIVTRGDLPATAEAVRDLFGNSEKFFERDVPVRLVNLPGSNVPIVAPLTRHNVVIEVHRLCQPVAINRRGEYEPITLPDRVAQMYLDMRGEWQLRPLMGVSASPLLSTDGTIVARQGYDPDTALWCSGIPQLTIPLHPSIAEAAKALSQLRQTFQTFPFADAPRCRNGSLPVETTDISQPPRRDESAFLAALLTAVCRPSLPLAPGFLIVAPSVSGAGSGKGLLSRAICSIAFGVRPRAFTGGASREEIDKRIAAELLEAHPMLFLDNVNGVMLRSDTLASVLTERPARVRQLGASRMMLLNSIAFIVITGNGLTVTEDLARRFNLCELDARCEDPETRPFDAGFLQQIERQRLELLAACLTIWRWGRQNSGLLSHGKPLGSFEVWAEWCRDPLVALGCQDPVERIELLKANDPRRQRIGEFFEAWWRHHGCTPIKANQLADPVKCVADPQARGRQYLARFVAGLAGTRAAGFILNRQEAAGKWNASTYVLSEAEPDDVGHRTHGRPSDG